MRKVLSNLPLIIGFAIMIIFTWDAPFLRFLKTEQTFGYWVVVLVPAAVVLLVSQLVVWGLWSWTRPWRP